MLSSKESLSLIVLSNLIEVRAPDRQCCLGYESTLKFLSAVGTFPPWLHYIHLYLSDAISSFLKVEMKKSISKETAQLLSVAKSEESNSMHSGINPTVIQTLRYCGWSGSKNADRE